MGLKFRNVPSTSIATTPAASSQTAKVPQNFSRVSRPLSTPGHVQLTNDADTQTIIRAINDLHKKIEASTRAQRTSPENGAVYFQKIVVTANTPFTITHNLGRPYTGFHVVRHYSDVTGGMTLAESALGAGLTPDKHLAFTPSVSGTVDIKVF